MRWADEQEIRFLTNCEAVGVEKGTVHVRTLTEDKALTCDTIVSAAGFASEYHEELKKFLESQDIRVFVVGSAREPGKIFDATQSGFWTAVEI